MFDVLFASRDETAVMIMAIVVGGPLAAWVLVSVSENWRKARESEHQAILKQQMLDRGMSADDIQKVLNSGSRKPPHHM
jgi:hypothetical protein